MQFYIALSIPVLCFKKPNHFTNKTDLTLSWQDVKYFKEAINIILISCYPNMRTAAMNQTKRRAVFFFLCILPIFKYWVTK